MKRIIFVPQYPTQNRYQEWWLRKFSEEFIKAGFNVHVLGATKAYEMKMTRGNLSMFSPIHASIEFECAQIDEYMNMDIQDDDILFVADISFPGFFCNALFHKRTDKMFAFCHATSLNYKDYFEKVRNVKYPVETSHAAMFNKVFVGSKYHQDKLGWHNTVVTYLPFPPFLPQKNIKKYEIISASRPTSQKVDLQLESMVEEKISKIVRKDTRSWTEYFKFISESTVLLITSHEDTFGYQIVDAIMNGCIPIAPNRCAYPELLPKEYLYNDEEELLQKIDAALWGMLDVPRLKCKNQMDDFYDRIIEEINKEVQYPF